MLAALLSFSNGQRDREFRLENRQNGPYSRQEERTMPRTRQVQAVGQIVTDQLARKALLRCHRPRGD
jgi:hypothetical protein